MKAYSIFDDFGEESANILGNAGIDLTIHPHGVPRPNNLQMKDILQEYDCVIVGTSQKINEEMFDGIDGDKIIATASVGLDHIKIPEDKKHHIKVINTPKANAQSVAEYTIGCALACCKRIIEARNLYYRGLDNKKLVSKPEDLAGKTMGVIGAGNISKKIMQFAEIMGMNVIFWTAHPEYHQDLISSGIQYVELNQLVQISDIISVNLPNIEGTRGIISNDLIDSMKNNSIFISVSRLETVDIKALLQKANNNPNFYCCIDIDVNISVVNELKASDNIIITPHIAGGTVETRKRMFKELAEQIVKQSRYDK